MVSLILPLLTLSTVIPLKPHQGGRDLCRFVNAIFFHAFGDQKGQLQRLVGIEARVAMGVIAGRQIGFLDAMSTARAFGDLLAGHLDMDAAGVSALGLVNIEKLTDLLHDVIERAGLVTRGGLHRIAMHGIAGPDNAAAFFFDGADQFGLMVSTLCQRQSGRSASGGPLHCRD